MKETDINDILSVLRRQGMSKEFCEEIRKNADAGSLDYAMCLITGEEDNCIVDRNKSEQARKKSGGLFRSSFMRGIRY